MTFRWLYVAVVVVMFGLLIFLFGCHGFPMHPKPPTVLPPGPIAPPVQQVIQKAMNLPWLLSMSVFGIAGGIVGVLFLPGPLKTLALALTFFCVISLGLTLLVAQYAMWLVLGTVIACIGIGVYGIFRARNTHAIANQAIQDLVKTVNLTKSKLTVEAKEHLFGIKKKTSTKKVGGVIHMVQSPSTEAIVAEVRKQI